MTANAVRRAGEALGLIRPSSGPRPGMARVFSPARDSSPAEVLAGLAVTALVVVCELTVVFGDTVPTWFRPLAVAVLLLFLVRLVGLTRLFVRQYRTRRATRSAR